MLRPPWAVLLIAGFLPATVLADPTVTASLRPVQYLAYDSDSSGGRYRIPRPTDNGGSSSSSGNVGVNSSSNGNANSNSSSSSRANANTNATDNAVSHNGPTGPVNADEYESAFSSVNQDDLRAKVESLHKVLQGSIDQYGEDKQQAFNAGLGIIAKKEAPGQAAKIYQVQPGSRALAAGVHVGDRILKETLDKDVVHLTIARAEKTLHIAIAGSDPSMFSLNADQPALKVGASQTTLQGGAVRTSLGGDANTLTGGTNSVQLRANVVEQMRDHDVVLILDMSGSMRTPDCQGLSRWDWVGRQSNELAVAAQQASSDLTVMLFSNSYQVMEHVNPSLIPIIFRRVQPNGGTTLGAPLHEALSHYFAARQANPAVKPLIVAIITDGLPNDYPQVRQVIADAANSTRRDGEVSITFLLINGMLSGNRQMEMLDSQIGAQRDIVNLVEFDQVLRVGVKQALSEALSGRQMQNVPISRTPMGDPFSMGLGSLLGGRGSMFKPGGAFSRLGMPPYGQYPPMYLQPSGQRTYP